MTLFKKRLLKLAIILLSLGLFCFGILAGINIYVISQTKNKVLSNGELQNLDLDCILVLGAGVWGDRPSHLLEDRLLKGIELYKLGTSDKMLMTGDHGQKDYDEVNVMKNFAIENGVKSEHIFMDHAGFSTYESLYRARDIFKAKRIVIVSQSYHLYRAIYIGQKLGLEVYGYSANIRTYSQQPVWELREFLARVKDFFKVIAQPEPTYLGDPILISGNGDLTNDK